MIPLIAAVCLLNSVYLIYAILRIDEIKSVVEMIELYQKKS